MEFHILGPVEALSNGRVLQVGAAKERALLALLLLHSNRVVHAERLIELLWAGEPPETANNILQTYVSHLRRLLEPDRASGANPRVLLSRPAGYLLVVEPDHLDTERFAQLAQQGRTALSEGDPESAAARLREALLLWRGPALADLSGPFVLGERARLEEERLGAVEDRVDADMALGCHADLIGELQALVAEHPLRERLTGQLMLALYRSGRQGEASAVYQRLMTALDEQLAMMPSPPLRKLLQDILEHAPNLEPTPPADRIGPHSVTPQPNVPLTNLPLQLTSFVGRVRERAEVKTALQTHRLVTLTGSGGCGKTRLALEIATDLLDTFADGVVFVDLAPLADPVLVAPTIARSLGLRETGAEPIEESLRKFLRELLTPNDCTSLTELVDRIAAFGQRYCAPASRTPGPLLGKLCKPSWQTRSSNSTHPSLWAAPLDRPRNFRDGPLSGTESDHWVSK